jgi:signal transduction histidine kinase
MARRRTMLTSGRVGTIVSVLFGVFVLLDIALFGWLILKSLSQREIEKILVETREVAEPLARELQAQADKLGQEDLFVVVSVAEEMKTYMGMRLLEQKFVRSVEIRDRDGTVVYEQDVPSWSPAPEEEAPQLKLEEKIETEVPIGDLGTIVIGVSELELDRRIEVLRSDLVRQASLIGAITVTLLGAALVLIRRLFRRAEHLEDQAAEAERMAMIGTLASGLAHEIRNPLNSLNLNMQMLEESRDRSEGRLLAITRSEISRLENLVTDFLSYARPRPLECEASAPRALFARVAEVLAGEIRARGTELRIRDESGGLEVCVDRDQMNQVLLNLTKNALDATAEVDRRGEVELAAFVRAGRMALEVADNGGGIAEDDRPKIFDLFYSTRKGGTGLGLAIVERIARSHGAEIEVDSTPGEGTTVRLLLPVVEPSRSAPWGDRGEDSAPWGDGGENSVSRPPGPRSLPGS